MHLGYGVAAILSLVLVMTVRVAAHRVAALHGVLWLTHTKAVDSRYRQCNRQHRLKDPFHRSRHRREWANRYRNAALKRCRENCAFLHANQIIVALRQIRDEIHDSVLQRYLRDIGQLSPLNDPYISPLRVLVLHIIPTLDHPKSVED